MSDDPPIIFTAVTRDGTKMRGTIEEADAANGIWVEDRTGLIAVRALIEWPNLESLTREDA